MRSMTLQSPALKACLRLVAAICLLMLLDYLYSRQLIEALLPLLRRELVWLDDHFHILNLAFATQGYDSVIRLDVTLARTLVIDSHAIAPDPRAHAMVSTLASSVVQPAIIGFTLLTVWPASHLAQYLSRYVIGLTLLLLLLPFDIPFVLLGELLQVIVSSLGKHDFSFLISWKDFLQQGGRQVLGLCIAMISIVLADIDTSPRAEAKNK